MLNNQLWHLFYLGTEQGNKARIQQFVSAVSGSGLGTYIEKLSERERVELGQRYLTDYVLLSFKVHSEEELEVRNLYMFYCISQVTSLCSDVSVRLFSHRSSLRHCWAVCMRCR